MQHLRFLPILFCGILLFSCSKITLSDSVGNQGNAEVNNFLSLSQAKSLAYSFSTLIADDEKIISSQLTKGCYDDLPVTSYDVLVDDRDTLLYVFNFGKQEGFVIVSPYSYSFPVLAHSATGELFFSRSNNSSGLEYFIDAYCKKSLIGMNGAQYGESDWSDLGKEGYEYSIMPINEAPERVSKVARTESNGLDSIYPYTGVDLVYWCQEGGYNFYAENGACIGCPAIAIGMLMYDTNERITGEHITTSPPFEYYFDVSDKKPFTTGCDLTLKLRYIADSIPNYNWGSGPGEPSGASANDIQTGLRNLGFINATLVDYNFNTLYNNLKYQSPVFSSMYFHRGVLLAANNSINPTNGHIWFCDGYYEQQYLVQKKFLGIVISEWIEYEDRLYMNWGAGQDGGNGWYSALDNGFWHSPDEELYSYYKLNPKMYINLNYYAPPEQND